MIFENWLQLRGEAPPERTIQSISATRRYGLNHSLGGFPGEMVSFVGIYGTEPDQ